MKAIPLMRRAVWIGSVGLLLTIAGAGFYLKGRGKPKLNKILVISIDTLRADHLGYMNYFRSTSPAIDRLAAQSLDFRNAYSHASSTLPSHASMFTSLYPSVHKADMLRGIPLAADFTTIAEVFRDNGFRTAAFVEGGQLSPLWKLDQGFELYDVTEIRVDEGDGWLPDDLAGILAKAERWITRHRDEAFFCFVHSYVVHFPYQPRPPYDQMFDQGYQGPYPKITTYGDIDRYNETPRRPNEPYVRHQAALYDAEIRYTDDLLGGFFKRLDAMGMEDDTIVVFTSDHGEEFAEHGTTAKHVNTLYDELLHVPLLIRIPGMPPREIESQVRLIDLAPTLLGLMRVQTQGQVFQGVDLLASGTLSNSGLPVFSELVYTDKYVVSLRTGEHKLMGFLGAQGFRYVLYDLGADPLEQVDIFPNEPAAADSLVRQIEDIMAENRDHDSHLAVPVELDEATERELRALGYLK